jgi:hypothetical protein
MASDLRLSTTKAVKPGAYIGQVRTPKATAASGTPRYPSFVGRGSRLALARNVSVTRSFISGSPLTFPSTPPYTAALPYAALPDQTVATLYKADGTSIASSKHALVA